MSKDHFHSHALVESDSIGEGTRIWAFAHVMKGASIGSHCNIGEGCFIESGAKIGSQVTVKNNVCIWDGVTVEDRVFLGPNATLTNEVFPRSRRPIGEDKKFQPTPTLLREGAAIGANATILCGIEIGRNATIAAGSMVTKSVPEHALMAGNPARQVGWVCECGHRLTASRDQMVCGNCDNRYPIENNKIRF